ncbi:MAG TPA: PilN domain-containing protein [Elusimicrobiota bacterium]|nr:PilN domain-containing protein [Elusimicrobiota bacterium]
MIKVNLVPAEILAKARQRQLLLQASVVGGVLAVVLVVISLVHWAGLYRLQNEYNYKESKLRELSAIVAKVEELEKASEAVRARLGVIETLLKGRAFYPLFMSEFARTVPSGVKVTSMATAIQGNGGLKLTIVAVANSNDDVAAWMRTLEKDTHFAAVELGPVAAAGKGYNFTITTMYTLKL